MSFVKMKFVNISEAKSDWMVHVNLGVIVEIESV